MLKGSSAVLPSYIRGRGLTDYRVTGVQSTHDGACWNLPNKPAIVRVFRRLYLVNLERVGWVSAVYCSDRPLLAGVASADRECRRSPITSTTSRPTARKLKHVNGFSVFSSESGNFLILFYRNVNRFDTKEVQSHDSISTQDYNVFCLTFWHRSFTFKF